MIPASDRSKQPTSSVGPVPVLHGADQAEPGVPVALELADHVDQVLQHPRPGDRAVLGDVPDQQGGHSAFLRHPDQRGGDLADLGDAAGRAVHLRPRAMVCTESTTSRSGSTCSTCPSTVARSVSAARSSRGRSAPIRSARSRTWAGRLLAGDVQHGPRRAGPPARRRRAAGWTCPPRARRRAAPPRRGPGRRRAPGRARPRRSTGARRRPTSTSPIGGAGSRPTPADVVRPRAAPASPTVPQAWHSPQRPTHLAAVQPHSVQRKEGRGGWRVALGSAHARTGYAGRRPTTGRDLWTGRRGGGASGADAVELRRRRAPGHMRPRRPPRAPRQGTGTRRVVVRRQKPNASASIIRAPSSVKLKASRPPRPVAAPRPAARSAPARTARRTCRRPTGRAVPRTACPGAATGSVAMRALGPVVPRGTAAWAPRCVAMVTLARARARSRAQPGRSFGRSVAVRQNRLTA